MPNSTKAGRSAALKFFGCSLLGVALFLTPITYNGANTIVLGAMVNAIQAFIGDKMVWLTVPIFVLGAILSLLYNFTPKSFAQKLPGAQHLIAKHWIWSVLAVAGGVFALMTGLGIGPEQITSTKTGGTAYIDVAGLIFLLIGLGCLFLPFLTDYGFLDFVGTLLQKAYQKLFGLPGRATVDTLTSWVGSSSIAVIMTGRQFEAGYYTAREAAVIATNFSVVSVPFVFFVAQIAGVGEYFFQLYATMFLICIICAVVTPKLPPLSRIADQYYAPVGKQIDEDVAADDSRLKLAYDRGLRTAAAADAPLTALYKGFWAMLDIFLMMMPAAMTIEFITLVLFHYTSLFQILSAPLVPVLEFMGTPEAAATAPGLIVGLLDQFVPAIIASEIQANISKFILAGLSVTQLIFFAETALLIKRSEIPLTTLHLVMIFGMRTLIATPILAIVAHIVF